MSELEYRRALKALPREIEPERDLWSGIAARIAPDTGAARRRPGWMRYAIAAGLTATAIALGALLVPRLTDDAAQLAMEPDTASPWVLREADLIKADLDAALTTAGGPEAAEYARAPNLVLSASLKELDSAQSELDQALRQNPDSTFLLDRIRRVQQQKARLTLRVMAA